MDEYRSARMAMIDSQLRTSGVTERRLLAAISAVPREIFVADGRKPVAYVDDLEENLAYLKGRHIQDINRNKKRLLLIPTYICIVHSRYSCPCTCKLVSFHPFCLPLLIRF